MSTKSSSQRKYGPWALVTGASSGIGAEIARQIAVKAERRRREPGELDAAIPRIREALLDDKAAG